MSRGGLALMPGGSWTAFLRRGKADENKASEQFSELEALGVVYALTRRARGKSCRRQATTIIGWAIASQLAWFVHGYSGPKQDGRPPPSRPDCTIVCPREKLAAWSVCIVHLKYLYRALMMIVSGNHSTHNGALHYCHQCILECAVRIGRIGPLPHAYITNVRRIVAVVATKKRKA